MYFISNKETIHFQAEISALYITTYLIKISIKKNVTKGQFDTLSDWMKTHKQYQKFK